MGPLALLLAGGAKGLAAGGAAPGRPRAGSRHSSRIELPIVFGLGLARWRPRPDDRSRRLHPGDGAP